MSVIFVERNAFDSYRRTMNNLKRTITNSLTLESRLLKELFAEFLGTTFLMVNNWHWYWTAVCDLQTLSSKFVGFGYRMFNVEYIESRCIWQHHVAGYRLGINSCLRSYYIWRYYRWAVIVLTRITGFHNFFCAGGHLNPCISITFALLGELQWMKVPLYILAQLLGAFVGSAFAYGIYYGETTKLICNFYCTESLTDEYL